MKLIGLNIKPLNPAITKFTTLALESGNISVSTRVKYRSTKSGPQLRANGSVSLGNLRLNETDTGERFLEWKEMAANGIKFGLSPNRLQVEEVRLLEPSAKVVIFKDRSVNLTKALRDQNAAITDKKPQTAQTLSPPAVSQENRALFPVNIDRVRVEKDVVDFADLSLVLPFATQATDFNGGVTGITSEPTSRASVKFDGRVDQYGLSTVKGSLNPFTPKTFTDISVLFRNMEMKPFTPYSATFAGRKIASGKLNLNLEYKIQNSELLGENKVLLEQFTLGERVEAPDAIRLPLDLAIALLTDAQGKIDVAVPVYGNVDHPDFKYGRAICQAFVKLTTKVVIAPFRAMGNLFGDKGEQMDAIADFETQYEKTTGMKAERANFAMAVIGWASSDTAFYQALFEELVKLEPLTDNDLKKLALRRTEEIIKELKTTCGLDNTRMTARIPGPVEKASTKTVNTKLTLYVIKPTVQEH